MMNGASIIDDAASEALDRWSNALPPDLRIRAEALCTEGAVRHLTPLRSGEWAAWVRSIRDHEVVATWDGREWTLECVGDPAPDPAAAAAMGFALLAQDRHARRARLLGDPSGPLRELLPATASRLVIPCRVRLEVTWDGLDWFDLRAVRDIADTTLTALELKALTDARGEWVDLGRKGWRRLDDRTDGATWLNLNHAGLTPRGLSSETRRLHVLQPAVDEMRHLLPATDLERVEARRREIGSHPAPDPPPSLEARLRPYQLDGFKFLCALSQAGCGGILADDMGLGKTVQALAWLAHLRQHASGARPHPALVVCPKSLMENWRAEARKFLPGLRVRIWKARDLAHFAAEAPWAGLNIVSHPQLRQLAGDLENVEFLAAIVDEAQAIKNPDSAIAKAARTIRARHRLALTGTPIENRLLDLWSIMAFAMPGMLGNRVQFERQIEPLASADATRSLAMRVRPFLLRRTKSQVARDLPARVEEDFYCRMGDEQRTLYRAELKKAQQQLLGVTGEQHFQQERFHVLASLTRLRQLCCDPGLVFPATHVPSAKLEAMDELLEPILAEGHKVLIFSQFATLLRTVHQRVESHQVPIFMLTGQTEARGAVVDAFNSCPGPAAFLISLKAGGTGLNLATASYVILFDPWWNPATEAQAIDRAHRIGQTRTVIAYRLLIRDSLEEKIRALQAAKAALAEGVLGEEALAKTLSLEDLHGLLAG